MKIRTWFAAAAIASIAFGGMFGGSAVADHDACAGNVVDLGGAAYIDQRGDDPRLDWWYYQETNGIPGLQSGSQTILAPSGVIEHTDECAHENPDQLIY